VVSRFRSGAATETAGAAAPASPEDAVHDLGTGHAARGNLADELFGGPGRSPVIEPYDPPPSAPHEPSARERSTDLPVGSPYTGPSA
jgi:hypothetical protein